MSPTTKLPAEVMRWLPTLPPLSSSDEGAAVAMLSALQSVSVPPTPTRTEALTALAWPERLLALLPSCSHEQGVVWARRLSDLFFDAGCPSQLSFVLLATGVFSSAETFFDWWEWSQDLKLSPSVIARMISVAGTVERQATGSASLAERLHLLRRLAFRAPRGADQQWAKAWTQEIKETLGVDEETFSLLETSHIGFDRRGIRTFKLGTHTYSLFIKGPGELTLRDEKGRQLQKLGLPSNLGVIGKDGALQRARFERARDLTQEVFRRSSLSLEEELSSGVLRAWSIWKQIFGQNPILSSLAQTLVWVSHAPNGSEFYFRPTNDRSCISHDNNEVFPEEEAHVQLAHPALMPQELIRAWETHLADYLIVQPFLQLQRPCMAANDPRLYGPLPELNDSEIRAISNIQGWELHTLSASSSGRLRKLLMHGKLNVVLSFQAPSTSSSNHAVDGLEVHWDTVSPEKIVPATIETILRSEAMSEILSAMLPID